MAQLSPSAPNYYRLDVYRLSEALEPYVSRYGALMSEGPDAAPRELVELSQALTSLGWANGWLIPDEV